MHTTNFHMPVLRQRGRYPVCLAAAWLLVVLALSSLTARSDDSSNTNAIVLLPQAFVDSQGAYLDQLVENGSENSALHIRVGAAPNFGQALVLTRAQILAALKAQDPELAKTEFVGSERVRVTRRTRLLKEADLKELLLAVLQRDFVRDRGDLEINLTRPWNPVLVPDEALELKVVDAPVAGVSPSFILRFELLAGKESIGKWQTTAQGKIWKEIWVAAAPLKRGQLLSAADMTRERRDILSLRDLLVDLPGEQSPMELTENIPAGAPIWLRSARARPIVHRGDLIEALIQDDSMSVSLKVEVLEEGAFGQAIRVRNPETRRELRGKVQNEKTVLVVL